MSDMVVMGRIVAPYGVLGWVKVVPATEQFDGLLDYKNWWVGKGDHWIEHKVSKAKVHNDVLLVKLAGIDDRDLAFAAKGKQISVPKEALPEAGEGEYYWSDLIGLAVTNQQDIVFGKIIDVFDTGANDVIVVRPEKSKEAVAVESDVQDDAKADKKAKKNKHEDERLIPFVDDVIVDVDLAKKTMLVDWDETY
jgi:16S rRNA processing protein RimM